MNDNGYEKAYFAGGCFWCMEPPFEAMEVAEQSKVELENSGKFNKPVVTAISEAPAFYIAEEYHQDFYKKQSMRYQMYAKASGRKGFLEDTWGED